MKELLVLRPQPGAGETAERAAALGLKAVVAPLFAVRTIPWEAPEPGEFDAVMLTSANAARHGGPDLAAFLDLPCYAVGEATAAAAKASGFTDVRTGPEDGLMLLLEMARDGIARALHPCGVDHISLEPSEIRIVRLPVYEAEPALELPPAAAAALARGAVALLHSPRAAKLFARFLEERREVCIAAISARTARAAGDGWARVAVAERPRDHALLELAAKLCQTERQ